MEWPSSHKFSHEVCGRVSGRPLTILSLPVLGVLSQNWVRNVPKRTVSCILLKVTCHDEYHGFRSGTCCGTTAQGGHWPSQEAFSRPAFFLPVFSNS
ncbi:hypothetical protein TNCV_2467461 [Trichonephila clavipes]|nr:hypothetical protein TNCV_2467461 [Trichonephila clavipes]